MNKRISRRDFIKLAGFGVVASTANVLSVSKTQISPFLASGKVNRPILTIQDGEIATACLGCDLNCGLLIRVENGIIQNIAGNPKHPINHGMVCSHFTELLESYRDDVRFTGPLAQLGRGSGQFSLLNWDDANNIIRNAYHRTPYSETVFLMDSQSGHLDDFLVQLSRVAGGIPIYRLSDTFRGEGAQRLIEATQRVFGNDQIPYFDTQDADLVFAFGINGSEPWFSGISHLGLINHNQDVMENQNSKFINFSSTQSNIALPYQNWVSIQAGSECLILRELEEITLASQQGLLPTVSTPGILEISRLMPLTPKDVLGLVNKFISAKRKIVLPGLNALNTLDGYEIARSILRLNVATANLGRKGGLSFSAPASIYPENQQKFCSVAELNFLIERMLRGWVKTIFVFGNRFKIEDSVRENFISALKFVPQVISFSSSPDEISAYSDFIFPDHHLLERWGYQKISNLSDRPVISGFRPVYSPAFNTRASIDVLLGACHLANGDRKLRLPYLDHEDFLRQSIAQLYRSVNQANWTGQELIQQPFFKNGGWWPDKTTRIPPVFLG